ncbi:NTF2-like N-terminal transpeptidase domain-containing protein [Klenkia terrae]|uniref:NTF2-like N-terminal transpeptidase domain-containing protein n=1 Tax=Klenkia terrae TaxID=1052259 RepID=UPI003616536A
MSTRRGAVLLVTTALLAVPVLAACSSDDPADGARSAAQAFLDAWTGGDLEGAAGDTDDPATTTALLQQTATDLPDATLAADLGEVTVTGDDETAATAGWTATWDLAAAPDWTYTATLDLTRADADADWQVVAEPTVVHPELGVGQHLQLSRALPERAAITDASGAPLFTETEVVNVGVDKAQVTDLPTLAAALGAATGIDPATITTDVEAAGEGQFVPVITLRRPDFEAIRAQVFDLPGAVFPTSTRVLAPTAQFGAALLGRVGDATAEAIEETPARTASRSTPPGTPWACPGCSAPTRSSSPAPPASRCP